MHEHQLASGLAYFGGRLSSCWYGKRGSVELLLKELLFKDSCMCALCTYTALKRNCVWCKNTVHSCEFWINIVSPGIPAGAVSHHVVASDHVEKTALKVLIVSAETPRPTVPYRYYPVSKNEVIMTVMVSKFLQVPVVLITSFDISMKSKWLTHIENGSRSQRLLFPRTNFNLRLYSYIKYLNLVLYLCHV